MEVSYSPKFIRRLKSLPPALQEEAMEKIDLFHDEANHLTLKVHKLRGRLEDCYSFSVNYQTRIIFIFLTSESKEAYLLTIGSHSIYD